MSDKPTIFIASSSEAISVAEAVNIKLEREMRVTLWENAFDLSSITITNLIGKTKNADYAVFVFHKDDKSLICETEYDSVRDNVVLELGMFIGAIGLEKCFILVPKSAENAFRLPTDLAGVTASFYDDRESEIDAVTSSCAKIKQSIKKQETAKTNRVAATEVELLRQQLQNAESSVWSMRGDLLRKNEQYQSLHKAIETHFHSIAKPATPVEIKAWEDGAKNTHLIDVKIFGQGIYYVAQDAIIPPFYGAGSVSVIVAVGVNVYGVDKGCHNRIYYMDGFRASERL